MNRWLNHRSMTQRLPLRLAWICACMALCVGAGAQRLDANGQWIMPRAPAGSGIYRCKQPDGSQTYQQEPCTTGKEVVTDAPFVRERQQREREEQQWQKDQAERAQRRAVEAERSAAAQRVDQDNDRRYRDGLRMCRQERGFCGVDFYLTGMKRGELMDSLGNPDSTQKIGRRELWYYDLWLTDVNKKVSLRRVQVSFDDQGKVDGTNVY